MNCQSSCFVDIGNTHKNTHPADGDWCRDREQSTECREGGCSSVEVVTVPRPQRVVLSFPLDEEIDDFLFLDQGEDDFAEDGNLDELCNSFELQSSIRASLTSWSPVSARTYLSEDDLKQFAEAEAAAAAPAAIEYEQQQQFYNSRASQLWNASFLLSSSA